MEHETTKRIALILLSLSDSLNESEVRRAVQNAADAVHHMAPGEIIPMEDLVAEIKASLKVEIS